MNNNVASFDSFDTDQQIAAHQAGLVRVVLEGKTDVELFGRFWFVSLQENFQFIEARKLSDVAGCTGVANAVLHSKEEGIPAIGIIDRDTLFRAKDWPRLFSLDPATMNADWKTTGIYVASLWEVEAYLLEPDLLSHLVASAHRSPPGSAADCERALPRTVEACEFLLAAAPFFAAQHESGIAVSPNLFCDQTLARVVEVCEDKVGKAEPKAQEVAAQVKALVATVLASQPVENTDRLRFLLRYVDTKRLLSRLVHVLHIREEAHWTLATFMLHGQRRPTELEGVLSTIEADLAA